MLPTLRETTGEWMGKSMTWIWERLVPIDSSACDVYAKGNHAILEPKTAIRQAIF